MTDDTLAESATTAPETCDTPRQPLDKRTCMYLIRSPPLHWQRSPKQRNSPRTRMKTSNQHGYLFSLAPLGFDGLGDCQCRACLQVTTRRRPPRQAQIAADRGDTCTPQYQIRQNHLSCQRPKQRSRADQIRRQSNAAGAASSRVDSLRTTPCP